MSLCAFKKVHPELMHPTPHLLKPTTPSCPVNLPPYHWLPHYFQCGGCQNINSLLTLWFPWVLIERLLWTWYWLISVMNIFLESPDLLLCYCIQGEFNTYPVPSTHAHNICPDLTFRPTWRVALCRNFYCQHRCKYIWNVPCVSNVSFMLNPVRILCICFSEVCKMPISH